MSGLQTEETDSVGLIPFPSETRRTEFYDCGLTGTTGVSVEDALTGKTV